MNVTIDGVNLRNQFKVAVVDHEGKFTVSTRKGTTSFSFPDEHGEHPFVDAEDIRFEPNTINLTCVLYGSTQNEFMQNYRALKDLLEKSGLRKLKFGDTDGTIHEVYVSDGARINIRGKWSSGQIVSNEFVIPFIEPNPIAEALQFQTDSTESVSGTIETNDGDIILDWGDGNVEEIASGSSNLSHDYSGTSETKNMDATFKKSLDAVTNITLASFSLVGAIVAELGRCKNLATLDLGSNSLASYERTSWNVPDGVTIDLGTNSTLSATEISNLLIDLDNPRSDLAIVQNGTLTATGCNGGTCTYADLTADGQTAHDDLTNNNGWTINLDV